MAVYAIGDVQGCYIGLCRLLESIQFDETVDQLWFCGDLVNRGPQSLETLRFIHSLGDAAITVLGNHDLHLLALYHSGRKLKASDSLYSLLNSPDCDELMNWLQNCPLLHLDQTINKLIVHAGIHPQWELSQASAYAAEVEAVLRGENSKAFFASMYGDIPACWSDDLCDMPRLRCITNILTRMRYLGDNHQLDMTAKGKPDQHPELTPWFKLNDRAITSTDIIFGHWSTLPVGAYGRHFATDGGCIWGGKLVALRIDQTVPQWYWVGC